MRPCTSASAALLLLALIAPAARGQRRPPQPRDSAPAAALPGQLDADVAAARATVIAFVAAEAIGAAPADSLLAPGADFIMTGILVTTRPRLAGLNGPGTATIETETTSLSGAFAWVEIGYAFLGRTNDLNERARATFVLEKQRAGWRIRHVHSSMVERW